MRRDERADPVFARNVTLALDSWLLRNTAHVNCLAACIEIASNDFREYRRKVRIAIFWLKIAPIRLSSGPL
jgi:hypothetical protein